MRNFPVSFALTLSCADAVGIVATVTTFLAAHGVLITEVQHYLDPPSNSTTPRIVFEPRPAADQPSELSS